MTIDGNRPTQNVYRLNGVIVNDYSNAGPGNVLGASLGVDAIQEFTVLTAQLFGGIRLHFRRSHQRHHQIRNELVPRQRLRIHPQRGFRFVRLFDQANKPPFVRNHSAVPAADQF